MGPAKNRKYNDEYIKYGFVSIQKAGGIHPLCVICHEVLSNDAMRPCRLTRHLITKHKALQSESKEFFEKKAETLKKMMLERNEGYFPQFRVTKEKKIDPYPGIKNKKQKLTEAPLSDDADDLAEDAQNSVADAVSKSPFYAMQLGQTADSAKCSQLIVIVRYIKIDVIKDELLFSVELSTAKAVDIMSAVSDFFSEKSISWQKLVGVCTDGASSILGAGSGFIELVREKNPTVHVIHCFTHRQALAAKTLPSDLNDVLNLCIKVFNYIKKRATFTRLFTALCEDLGEEHKSLLLHTEVHWLSKGNILTKLFVLRDEVISFLEKDNQDELCTRFSRPLVEIVLAYLSDIFESWNYLHLKVEGGDSNIIRYRDVIMAYVEKLQLWNRKILAEPSNYSSIPKLNMLSEETRLNEVFEEIDLKSKISEHLQELGDQFQGYFPNPYNNIIYRLVMDPFHVDIESLPENLQEQAIEIKHDSAAKYDFDKMEKLLFWVKYLKVYPDVSEQALRLLLPYSSVYLCVKACLAANPRHENINSEPTG